MTDIIIIIQRESPKRVCSVSSVFLELRTVRHSRQPHTHLSFCSFQHTPGLVFHCCTITIGRGELSILIIHKNIYMYTMHDFF